MTYEEFKQNFLPEFLKIKSFAGKMKYASQYLPRIGSGSGRIVYDIDGQKVLKLAKNAKGIAQNEVEAGAGYYRDTQDIVTIVFDSAENDEWLISEKAKKVNEKRIVQLTGIPSLTALYSYLKNFYDENHGRRSFMHIEPEVKEQLNENEFAQDLMNFIGNYNQSPGDYGRPSTYGEVLRDGQPTIVLTDYGFTDDVYNTHYSPKKKQQYAMYEMYNFADGNDDMLGDLPPQDAVDTHRGMWALMPYGVGDGDAVVNEEYIKFIKNNKEYPDKPISNLPVLADCFHECVNNLKEILDHTDNKNKFYNNLLALQDYLTAQGFYDREPIAKEEYEINEEDISQQTPHIRGNTLTDKNYATQIANASAAKLNIHIVKYLGGGSNGFAFDIGDLKVFKISADISEGDAAFKLLRVRPTRIAIVYNLYKIVDTEKNLSFFGIIEQHIVDKPMDKFNYYVDVINKIMPNNMSTVDFYIMMKKKFDYNNMVALAEPILTANPESGISEVDRNEAHKWIVELFAIKKELLGYSIKSNDYSNNANLGYDKGLLKFFDFGGYHGVEEPNIENGNTIILPESVQPLTEDYDRSTANVIANKIAELKGLNKPEFMGSGMLGVAYDIGDRVLKITKDNSEASENLMLIGKPLKYIAQPYNVFTVTSKTDEIPQTFAIVLEKLKTDPQEFKRLFDRLEFAFNKIMKVKFGDVLEFYLYGFRYDSDVDKNKIEKYFKTNSQDAEFFFSILRIAEECEKYGVESKDYYNVENLGYKKTGVIGFFDVGFGNGFLQPRGAENIDINEDGSSLYSTTNSFGQDNFPPYVQNDTSPMADNNVPTDDEIHEDLEYHHVVGDATQDKFAMDEGDKSIMKGSTGVEIKQKCRLGGLGNTSAQCNWGDMDAVKTTKVAETAEVKIPTGNLNAYESFPILNDGQTVGELSIIDRGVWGGSHYISVDKIFINKEFRGMGYANEAMEDLFEFADRNKIIITLTPDSLWGANKEKLRKWYQSLGFVMNKGKHKDFQTMQLMYKLPKSNLNEVGEANVEPYSISITRSDNMHKIYTFTTEDNDNYSVAFDSGGIDETNGLWTTYFGTKNDSGLFNSFVQVTNKGRIYRIMATLVKLIKGFLANTKPDTLVIEPTKTKNPDDRRRFILYTQFIKKHLPSDYEYSEDNKEILIKKKQQLNEQSFKDFEKQIEKDNKTHDLDKLLLFEEDDYKVYAVNGTAVRDNGFDEWVDGGHHYVDLDLPKKDQKYAKFIPEDEIWVDDVFLIKPDDLGAILLHETLERHLMKYYGVTYSNDKDGAHEIANKAEVIFRKKVKNDFGHSESVKIYDTFVENYAKKS